MGLRLSIMRTHARTLTTLLAGGLLLPYAPVGAEAPASVESRLAAQNGLFEEYYQTRLKELPWLATSMGDYRYNDRMADYSLAEVAREQMENDAFLLRLMTIPTDGFGEQDRLSHDLLISVLSDNRAYRSLKSYETPGDNVGNSVGVHVALADLPLSMPLDTVKHYEDYIARLHQIPLALKQTEDKMRVGMKDGLMPVKYLLEKVPVQCDGIIVANPFLGPINKLPGSFSAEDKARLTKVITDAVNDEVLPAYKAFGEFVANDYAPHGRTALGINSLPDGALRYQAAIHLMTTTDMTPDAIHALGLTEIARIEAEMTCDCEESGICRSGKLSRIPEDQSEVPTDIIRADSRRVSQVHRTDGGKTARAVYLHSGQASDSRGDSGIPAGNGDPRYTWYSGRIAARTGRGANIRSYSPDAD